ncbi:nuclear transport factor 2 family protein [Mucilaginibacter sp. BT774]|uniref:nuclear transport factor 2 family protein n=1 Tax=Mucilaginibacter sp. BT774 TaxID=3062276 RepID=UPI002676963C|nr:nuclear transport factor 2 family protein [Mucilaginibacter sp. BT774]MDO3628148.1 nuclear transport factor 2 family protein [Mucilaginibacter sp. BT774]
MIRQLSYYKTILILMFLSQFVQAQTTDLISEHFKLLNSHNIQALASEYTDDAEIFSPNWQGAKIGPAGITEVYSRYYKTTPDLTYTVTNTIKSGDNIIVQYSWGGTMAKPENGEPAYMEGKKYTLQCCAIFVIKNNKIIKETNYFDQVAYLRQVGFFDQR